LVSKGGFPQLLLSPVNFDALYLQQAKKASIDSTT
jgi:preprotein translocase subunit SecB